MPDLSQRSLQKELLDGTDIPFEEIARNMRELKEINKYLGGHRVSIKGLKRILDHHSNNIDSPILICEIGSGGGDNLNVIEQYCKKIGRQVSFIGVDINSECIEYAKNNCEHLNAEWICKDYRNVYFSKRPDIIFSSLFCHHFNNEELTEQFRWMYENSRLGFFVNDLHRNIIAYRSIMFITTLLSRSRLVKNDAPLSVLRGFKRKDLERLMQQSVGSSAQIKWEWAFRWLVVVLHDR